MSYVYNFETTAEDKARLIAQQSAVWHEHAEAYEGKAAVAFMAEKHALAKGCQDVASWCRLAQRLTEAGNCIAVPASFPWVPGLRKNCEMFGRLGLPRVAEQMFEAMTEERFEARVEAQKENA